MNIDYSIIIPAYNEEDFIEETLNQLQKAMSTITQKAEIIVTDNNSTNRTAEIAQVMGQEMPG